MAALYLEIDLCSELDLVWIVMQSAVAPLPPYWQELTDEDNEPYYYNSVDDTSTWEHPSTLYFTLLRDQVFFFWLLTTAPQSRKDIDVLGCFPRRTSMEGLPWKSYFTLFA